MEVHSPLPNDASMAEIEFRAGLIADPVQRLRFLREAMEPPSLRRASPWRRRAAVAALSLAVLAASVPAAGRLLRPGLASAARPLPVAVTPLATPVPNVWLVTAHDGTETYSNGLRIETAHVLSHIPRRYQAYDRAHGYAPSGWRDVPAGIVYHTTESHTAPFAAATNETLQRQGAGLLDHVARERAYHYVIDRFGRVFRVVPETDIAFHAGHSVWADERWAFLNLNTSFLGVAFEGQTITVDPDLAVTPAQVHAARVLTEWLRHRYAIPAALCVTHAQVSVNPGNARVGYHTDWARGFPFAALGLEDNYRLAPASLAAFGFRYDAPFLRAVGERRWPGLDEADRAVARDAAARGRSAEQHRAVLQDEYRRLIAHSRAARGREETPTDATD